MNNSIELRFGAPRLPLIDYPSLCPKKRNPPSPKAKKIYMPRMKLILDLEFKGVYLFMNLGSLPLGVSVIC